MLEHDPVVLTEDQPQFWLRAGDVGTVVFVHGRGEAYEVEFMTPSGRTIAVLTLPASAIRRPEGGRVG